MVREKIKAFAGTVVKNRGADGKGATFKLIILDEADALTPDAQAALRRTMEDHSRVTRFIFICNYLSRIIEPLASRCAKFRFKPLPALAMSSRLEHIAAAESIQLAEDALPALQAVSGGDMRRAITVLQSAAQLFCAHTGDVEEDMEGTASGSIDAAAVQEAAGTVPDATMDSVWGAVMHAGEIGFNGLRTAARKLQLLGYPLSAIIPAMQQRCVDSTELNDMAKAHVCLALAAADRAVADGADESIQLLALVAAAGRAVTGLTIPSDEPARFD